MEKLKIRLWQKLFSKVRAMKATVTTRLTMIRLVRNTRATSPAGWIIGLVLALYVTAYTLPQAIVALTNTLNWTGAPTAVMTLGTTVLAIIVILAVAIKFMPEEIRTKVGM